MEPEEESLRRQFYRDQMNDLKQFLNYHLDKMEELKTLTFLIKISLLFNGALVILVMTLVWFFMPGGSQ